MVGCAGALPSGRPAPAKLSPLDSLPQRAPMVTGDGDVEGDRVDDGFVARGRGGQASGGCS